ncbi:hypothetical protein [Moraxella lacunata]
MGQIRRWLLGSLKVKIGNNPNIKPIVIMGFFMLIYTKLSIYKGAKC